MVAKDRGVCRRIAFLLVPQFSMMAFSAAIEPLRSANRMSERELFAWRGLSVDGSAVTASNGIEIMPQQSLSHSPALDMLVVCAGLEPVQFKAGHPIFAQLRRLARHGSMVGAISTGSFILAEAGLLRDRRCTVHWEYANLFQSRYPTLNMTQELYVVDRDVFTCSGGTAALDMMLHFVSEASTPDVALAVAEQFIHPTIRKHEENQRIDTHARYRIESPKLVQIIRLMESAIEHPIDVTLLSDRAGISVRQTERLFHEQLGTTPKGFYLKLRLAWARTLLRQTLNTISAVGLECGFGSSSHFSHAYKQLYGIAPSKEREMNARHRPALAQATPGI